MGLVSRVFKGVFVLLFSVGGFVGREFSFVMLMG